MFDTDSDSSPVNGIPDEELGGGPDGLPDHPGAGQAGRVEARHLRPGQGPRQRLQKVPGSHQEEDRASYSVSMAKLGLFAHSL